MANAKISGLTELSTIASGDLLPIVDVSDTTDAATGTTKKITRVNLIDGLATLASPTFTGTVTIPTPFTLGAVSMVATGTELNYVSGVTSAIQTQLGNKQPLDADLTAIAALGFTATAFLKKTAADTWSLDTNTYLTAVGTGVQNELTYWATTSTIGSLATATYPSLTELTYVKGVTSAIQTQLGTKAPSTAPTFATSITGSYLTASEILITDASKNIISAAVATYPSLTELTYVKGVTSAIQTQLNAKAATLSGTINEIAYFNSSSTIASLAVATYPSLTELSYVKGLTSSAQTQITAKMTNPMTTGGDIIYGGASGVPTRLANGTAGQVLQSNGTTLAPSWVAAGAGDMVLASIQSVTGLKTFDSTKLAVKGSSTGSTAIASANASATAYTQTLQARDGTVANLDNVTFIGTTSVALNRSSAALVLTGITSIDGLAATATALATSRNLWGQAFTGAADVTGSLTSVGDITGGASSMIIQAGTGASRTLTFKTTTAGSVATTALTLAADQSATFANTVNATTFVGALTGTASGNLVSGGALGTPSSGTLTNCTGLPVAGLVALTASEIVITTAGGVLASAAVATYPSLTELSYVKGVTSAIQTQLGGKQATISFGTGVLTALGVNIGSAGAPVLFDGALGTPSSGALTNCTGLPVAGITASTVTALGVGSIELGHATDTTISRVSAGVIAVEGVNILTTAGGTLTGKIHLGEGADPATIGIQIDESLSADERYSGIVVAGTAGATLAFGDICYLDVTAGEWLLADASAAATAGDVPLGICVDASTDGNATSMLLIGTVRSAAFPASIALGAPLYVSETAGDVTATAPTTTDSVMRRVGWAVTAEPNTIYFNPSSDYVTHI